MSSDLKENEKYAETEQEEINAEFREERNRESQEGYRECWIGENIEGLRKDYCEEHEQEFSNFCKEMFKVAKENN